MTKIKPSNPPLRVAQLGVEHPHAAGKWETVRRLSDSFQAVGIWEPDPVLRERAAQRPEYADARWLTEAEFFRGGDFEAVLVETELPGLLAMAKPCLTAGWHVHLDKPPGNDLRGLAELQALASAKGLTLQLAYMFRHQPAFRLCLKLAAEGLLGEIFSVQADIGRPDIQERAWQARNYGGSMMVLGSHLLDIAIAVMGKPEKATAFSRRTFPHQDDLFDHEVIVLEYARGLATIRCTLAEVGSLERRQFAVCGERGTLEIRPFEPPEVHLTLQSGAMGYRAGRQRLAVPAMTGRYDDLMLDFAAAVAGRPSDLSVFTPAHDLLVQETLLRARPA